MGVQTFLAQPSVEGLHLGVVDRPTWPREVELDAVLVGPAVHRLRDELRSVVDLDGARQFALDPDALECSHDILSLQTLADVDGQALAAVVLDDGECAQPATVE